MRILKILKILKNLIFLNFLVFFIFLNFLIFLSFFIFFIFLFFFYTIELIILLYQNIRLQKNPIQIFSNFLIFNFLKNFLKIKTEFFSHFQFKPLIRVKLKKIPMTNFVYQLVNFLLFLKDQIFGIFDQFFLS